MRSSVYFWVFLTTALLISLAAMAAVGFPFGWIFLLTVLGHILIIIMVYKVLTDNYTTEKTFEDFYEDRPIDREPQKY